MLILTQESKEQAKDEIRPLLEEIRDGGNQWRFNDFDRCLAVATSLHLRFGYAVDEAANIATTGDFVLKLNCSFDAIALDNGSRVDDEKTR